jgi:N-acetylglucosamine-6-phosphate deacetylase
VLGLHIEGPFLNGERRGVHAAGKLRQLTREIVDEIRPLRGGVTLLTLAPETVEPELVRRLVDKGIIVACGHSNASAAQVAAALQAGLRGFSHLYNAMSQLRAREPGVVGQALADRDSWCGIIADGHHVAAAALEIARRCKGPERLMLVTDAMPSVGTTLTSFTLQGKPVTVSNGVCRDPDGTLAGAALDMASAVRNMAQLTGCPLAEACRMASAAPAGFLKLDNERGAIAPGLRADLVILDRDRQVAATIIGGEEVVA